MNKRTMKKGLAIVLALVMVFAMTATAFASTNTDILVNVTIDTRTLSRSAVFMSKTDGTALGTTPVVTTTVTVPSGSNVLTVLNAAKTALGFEVISEASSYGGTFVTDIAGVGEKNFVGDKVWNTSTNKYDYQFTYTDSAGVQKNSLFSSESSADDYLLFASGALCSGWVYSVNGYYPSVAMDLYTTVTNNCNVNFRYTVTGSYDVNTSSFPSAPPYPNLDCDFLDLYDSLAAITNPTTDQTDTLAQVNADMTACERVYSGKTWTSPFYLASPMNGGYIDLIQSVL